jgi:hypothetical protein
MRYLTIACPGLNSLRNKSRVPFRAKRRVSLFLDLNRREILRFARNDTQQVFLHCV